MSSTISNYHTVLLSSHAAAHFREEQHQNISESLLLVTGTETEEYFGPLDTGKSESLKHD